jgi:hypothetical protein
MTRLGYCCALYTLLFISPAAQTAAVMRCENEQGHITFTQFGCNTDQLAQAQTFYNPPPGSVRPAPPPPQNTDRGRKPNVITIVGGQDSPCDQALTSEEKRRALIRKQIHPGMTRNEVESSLGQPDSIRDHNGQTRYIYQSSKKGKKSKQLSISFDENGCVKGNTRKARIGKSEQ